MRKIIVVLTVCLCISLLCAAPGRAQTEALNVYYLGAEGAVKTALTLTPLLKLVDDPAQAQAFVFYGQFPAEAAAFAQRVRAGAGLVIFPAAQTTAADLAPYLGETAETARLEEALSLAPEEAQGEALVEQVLWTSAPQVRERLAVQSSALESLVRGYETGETVLGRARLGKGQVYLFTALLDGSNPQLQEWAYFNYLAYALCVRAAEGQPLPFADYPASPVPHERERLILFGVLGVILVSAFAVFFAVRRYSLRNPQLLDGLVRDRKVYEAREAGTAWEEIGFHRPLGGFLVTFMFGIVLFIPLIIYQNLILPGYVLPSAQALGIWGRVIQFFNVLWLFLDMGTSAAFIKFFSQHRVNDPRRAIQYGQIFVWWQVLSGAVQVALVSALSGILLPRTAYAIYAWSVILHTAVQIPGIYKLFRHALTALQRFDYAQMIELAFNLVFPMVTQPILVTVMVLWGRSHPAYGAAMGGLLGMGMAAYASELLMFIFGYALYRRVGYNASLLLLAHFDWALIKEAFRFGIFEMLGSMAWGIGQALEVLITQARLVNYAEIWGNWGLAQNFVFAFNVLATLYDNEMASISEAISHGRRMLSQYYSAMAYKYGGMVSVFIGAVLLAVADRFILGSTSEEFHRAALYVIPLIFWGMAQYPSWVGDMVQRGANRPYLIPLMVGMEQCIRIGLAWLLLERLQVTALIIAYLLAILIKDVVAYFVNQRMCFQQRFYFWQSLGAPLLAGAAHYGVLRVVSGLLWQGEQVTSVLIFFLGIFVSYPLYAFFYGLAGGWDSATLDELRQAAELTGFMRPLARLFHRSTALGARLSPLTGRFPITIRPQALEEAHSLSEERVRLV